jgi:SAM-dependent methyltransferase
LKPVSEPCLRNQRPITEALTPYLIAPGHWLEVGSGTGQHGVYIAGYFPGIVWQLTDLPEAQEGLRLWQTEAGLDNLPPPQILDVTTASPGENLYDGVFTANTIHFVSWTVACRLIRFVGAILRPDGVFGIYGPLNENGQFTSEGNARLDTWLKERDGRSGIKDREEVVHEAQRWGMTPEADVIMPANNRLLVFRKI